MKSKSFLKRKEYVIKNGKPVAVILNIDDYKEILEKIEDIEDLNELNKIRKNKPKFRKIEEFLEDK